jgi:hypothetical protein
MRKLVTFLFLLAFLAVQKGVAQKYEAAFSVGGVVATDAQVGVVCIAAPCNFPTLHIPVAKKVAFQGTLAARLLDAKAASLSLEVPLVGIPGREAGGPGLRFSSFFFTPGVKLNFFPKAGLSPFATVGGGLAHFGGDASNNSAALQFGGGVDVKTRLPHLGLRGEVRDFYTASPNSLSDTGRMHNVFIGGGVVFKF